VLVMCGRDDPEDAGIDPNKIRIDIEEDRYNKRAQRYLRDLRRDAVIEYR
jgi:peptidyl-prolyl cis-trans isomerase SurA